MKTLIFLSSLLASATTPIDLRCEYLTNPTAIQEKQPRLSWRLQDTENNIRQTAYQIQVSPNDSFSQITWDSGETKSSATHQIHYTGPAASPSQTLHWRVRSMNEKNTWSPWSTSAHWTQALSPNDWTAQFISDPDDHLHWTKENIQNMANDPTRGKLKLRSTSIFRKEFSTPKKITRATIHATALGIYKATINGQPISDELLAPGWTNYHKRLHYRSHDVTALIQNNSPNTICAELAEGWYAGYVAYGLLTDQYGLDPEHPGRSYYGTTPALSLQLDLEYTDGSRESIITDRSWKVKKGPTTEADILMGETHDARELPTAWQKPNFNDSSWKNPIVRTSPHVLPTPHPTHPIRTIQELKPISVREHTPGVFIFDLGQNISGIARIKATGPAGTKIKLRFAEMLHADGRLSTENLRCARATDTYIMRGDTTAETWSPSFTFHGFQYIEVTGYPGKPTIDDITGLVLHTDLHYHSTFACSDPMLNQLHSNIIWTQRANFIDLPTDCPQRDERMGWTGDAQAYVNAAAYHADISSFYKKWLRDLNDDQWHHGAYPHFAPMPFSRPNELHAAAWMDAGILCPWTIYQIYGDKEILTEHWLKMTKFMNFRHARDPQLKGTAESDSNFGDWLAPVPTPIPFIDLCFHARCCTAMAEMATALGKPNETKKYTDRFEKLRQSFLREHTNPDQTIKHNTQTAYVLALFFDLYPQEHRTTAATHLAELVRKNDNKLATGFLGTRPLLTVLSKNNQHQLAGILMQQKQYPSWGYEVENGATTIWERWNSYVKGKGVHEPTMNSFSHYSFGAVTEWMMGTLVGITPATPGYDQIHIHPQPTGTITHASGSFMTRHGKVACAWNLTEKKLTITIPPNTTAKITLPDTLTKILKTTPPATLTSGTYQF